MAKISKKSLLLRAFCVIIILLSLFMKRESIIGYARHVFFVATDVVRGQGKSPYYVFMKGRYLAEKVYIKGANEKFIPFPITLQKKIAPLIASTTPTVSAAVILGLTVPVISHESETMVAICNGNIDLPSSGGQDSKYDKFILEASCASSINPLLIKAVVGWKSGFDNSPKNSNDTCITEEEAVGLGGLTAKAVKKYKLLLMPDKNNPNQRDLRCDPRFAIMATGKYIRELVGEYAKYESKVELALMDYDKGIKLPAKIRGRNEFKWEKISKDKKLPKAILNDVTETIETFKVYQKAVILSSRGEIHVSPPVVTASKTPATTAIPAVITENVISSDDKVLPIEFPFRGEIELAINQLGIVPPYIAGSVMAWEWRLKKDGWSEFEKKFEKRCAVNFAGAIGPGQQLQKTFKRFGPKGGNICNPADNIYALINQLGFLWNYYQSIPEGDRWPIVWIAYHSGEGLVDPLLRMAKGLGLPQNFKTLSNPNFDLPYPIDTGMYEQSGLGPDGREYVPGVLGKLAELQGVEIGDVTQFASISSQSIQLHTMVVNFGPNGQSEKIEVASFCKEKQAFIEGPEETVFCSEGLCLSIINGIPTGMQSIYIKGGENKQVHLRCV